MARQAKSVDGKLNRRLQNAADKEVVNQDDMKGDETPPGWREMAGWLSV
jgi:hypothetical protein